MTPNGIVTLLTDFGTVDGYVAAMKGTLVSDAPEALRIVDITHNVPPQDVAAGARALETAAPHFPKGTIHVCVVDPGVGSSRRAIAVRAWGQLFLGPDNGLLTPALRYVLPRFEAAVLHIDRIPPEWKVAPTFHGRDVFARIANRLVRGDDLADYASGLAEDPVVLPEPLLEIRKDGSVVGEVVHIDHFGNLLTSISAEALRRSLGGGEGHEEADVADAEFGGHFLVEVEGKQLPLCVTFADVSPGVALSYVGSGHHVEIAIREGSAALRLGLGRGVRVVAKRRR